MKTEIGEYVVGAYLKLIKKCDFVDYNVRPPGGGMEGLGELDVIGLDFQNKTAYICEVATHILGLLYGKGNKDTIERIGKKYERQKAYAEKYLTGFESHRFLFWSPRVPEGILTNGLAELEGLELVINRRYTECVDELRAQAKVLTNDVGNPFFRALQILEALKR